LPPDPPPISISRSHHGDMMDDPPCGPSCTSSHAAQRPNKARAIAVEERRADRGGSLAWTVTGKVAMQGRDPDSTQSFSHARHTIAPGSFHACLCCQTHRVMLSLMNVKAQVKNIPYMNVYFFFRRHMWCTISYRTSCIVAT
jgi:hypothetical protein